MYTCYYSVHSLKGLPCSRKLAIICFGLYALSSDSWYLLRVVLGVLGLTKTLQLGNQNRISTQSFSRFTYYTMHHRVQQTHKEGNVAIPYRCKVVFLKLPPVHDKAEPFTLCKMGTDWHIKNCHHQHCAHASQLQLVTIKNTPKSI